MDPPRPAAGRRGPVTPTTHSATPPTNQQKCHAKDQLDPAPSRGVGQVRGVGFDDVELTLEEHDHTGQRLERAGQDENRYGCYETIARPVEVVSTGATDECCVACHGGLLCSQPRQRRTATGDLSVR